MSVSTTLSQDGKSMTIKVNGRFDFHIHEAFRQAYQKLEKANSNYVVDMGSTEYMDSSALGMLLMLREYAGGDKSEVRIENCRDEIKEILNIANFHKLFSIV